MRIRITELQTLSGMTDRDMAELLWPESSRHSRRVLLAKARKKGTKSITLSQLKVLCDRFETSNVHKLIDFADVNF